MNEIPIFSDWLQTFDGSITVMDLNGKILFMNTAAGKVFEKFGGVNMVDSNIEECHQDAALQAIKNMLESDSRNIYTIEKNGVKKIVYQAPWYKNKHVAGLVSLSLAIPEKIPHYKR